MARRVYHWKHGWIPLTHTAAMQKAKGSEKGAAKLERRHGIGVRGRSARRTEQRRREREASQEFRGMSDDDLAEALVDVGDDEAAVGRVLAELDRRDRAEQDRKRREANRQRRDEARDEDFDRRLAAGEDAEAAYAAVYGVSEERQRREGAIASLKAAGYRGRGLDELSRSAFKDHARQAYLDAEDVTRGILLNRAGKAAGIHPSSLFTGNEATARKYASEELLGYWQENGRMTLDDIKAGLLGGAMRSTAAFL
jgi:hypothetical protein